VATTQETSVIEVIGAGASGRALAFLLLKSGCPVRLLGRSGPIKQLTVIENKVKKSIELPPLHAEPAMHLLTVPAHGLKEASESIQQTTSAPIVPLCNGYLGDKYYQKPYAAGINYIASTFNRATDEVSLFSSVPGVFLPKSLAQLMPQNLPFIHFVDSKQMAWPRRLITFKKLRWSASSLQTAYTRQQTLDFQVKKKLSNISCSLPSRRPTTPTPWFKPYGEAQKQKQLLSPDTQTQIGTQTCFLCTK
jgi:hypothetical protein